MNSIFKKCRKFSMCSVNNCPLNPEYPDLFVHEKDSEQKCRCSKKCRIRIAKQCPGILKYDGMTVEEYKDKQILEAMSEER